MQLLLVYIDDKFSKLFKTYLGKDSICNSINNMIKESKYYSEVMKKHFNKKPVMTTDDNKNFKNYNKWADVGFVIVIILIMVLK